MTQPNSIGDMPDEKHAELVNPILAALERNLGIRVVQWERAK